MKNPTKRDVDVWAKIVKMHKRRIKVDYPLCIKILKSKAYDEPTYIKHNNYLGWKAVVKCKVAGKGVTISRMYNNYYSYPCWGLSYEKGTFSNEVIKMEYLSEFLARYPAFIGQKYK